MKYWPTIRKELPKTLLQILISAAVFLLAPAVNAEVSNRHDRGTYRSMIASIQSEAKANKAVLDTSFAEYFPSGVIIKEFSYSAANQCLSNPLFVKQAKQADIETLYVYVRDLSLSNRYRRVVENLAVHNRASDACFETVKQQWGQMLGPMASKNRRGHGFPRVSCENQKNRRVEAC